MAVTGRRRLVCHHEAGHALVRTLFGYWTHRATVLTRDEIRSGMRIETESGRFFRAEGFVEGPRICAWPYGPTKVEGGACAQQESDTIRAICRDIALVECMAGFVSEARYRKRSMSACAFEGSRLDMADATELLDAWNLKGRVRRATSDLALRRASAIVRSSAGASAVSSIAQALYADGVLDGVQVRELCREAYGGRSCAYGAWRQVWPPTLVQLRSGSVLT